MRWRLALIVLLATWATAGVFVSVRALIPAVEARFRDSSTPTVGMPMLATSDVQTVRRLLTSPSDEGRVGVLVLPASTSRTPADYLRQQLAYLEYPQWVRVVIATDGVQAAVATDSEIITLRSIRLPGSWAAMERAGSFIRYRRKQ